MGFKIRMVDLFLLLLACVWILVLNQIGTVQVLDQVKFGVNNFFEAPQSDVQVFTAVGFQGCRYTALANRILARVKESYPEEVYVYSWTAPNKAEFKSWLDSRKATAQVPAEHSSAPVVFNRLEQTRVFLGGTTELLQYLEAKFPDIDLSAEQADKEALDILVANKAATAMSAKSPPSHLRSANPEVEKLLQVADEEEAEEIPEVPAGLANVGRISAPRETARRSGSLTPAGGETNKYLSDPVNQFAAQVSLRPNLVYTSYRLAEGKGVTNYKPMAYSLKGMGWKFIQAAPLLASWILVQDQTTAAYVLKRYRRSIVNNIGYGGQSCFGGTKGTQLRCRAEFAEKSGCAFDDLHIQPPQYRLWLADECSKFFDEVCNGEEAERYWMEKPSGGQHGAGMQVRNGCREVRSEHPSCAAESTKKKVIIMPYLDPALMGGHKFDVRSFLLVASTDPQLVFYHDGFARKANSLYTSDLSDRNAHITNAESQSNKDHFFGFKSLQDILHRESGFPADYMTRVFRQHAMKVENFVFQVSRQFMARRKGMYQIFALDWIIDSKGGIHMLEANSNPLVTVFDDLKEEFTETWDGMTDLVLRIQTNPASLLSSAYPRMATAPKRFVYRDWALIFNELEEKASGDTYNPCKLQLPVFDISQDNDVAFPAEPEASSADSEAPELVLAEPDDDQRPALDLEADGQVPAEEFTLDLGDGDSSSSSGAQAHNGNRETPYEVDVEAIQKAVEQGITRPCVEFDPFEVFQDCVVVDRGLGPSDRTVRCEFTEGGHVYIIDPMNADQLGAAGVSNGDSYAPPNENGGVEEGEENENAEDGDVEHENAEPAEQKQRGHCFPVVMITAGVHGNELAGIVAARHIRKTWRVNDARLVVVERLNPRGAEKRGRYIPRTAKKEQDLNRNFPKSGLVGDLAQDIWAMVYKIKPHVFVDCHEGWGFYGKLRANYVKGGPLVGNPKFSKGSSVIASPSAHQIAKFMANRVNEETVTDHSKDFLAIVPPIETGLANMVMREFGSLVTVIETTSGGQALALRARQQLVVVGTFMSALGIVPSNFDGRAGFADADACVAGANSCRLQHPDDTIVPQ